MTDKPIIFSAPMVRAILDGSKTQTRRVVKNCIGIGTKENPLRMDLMKSPYGKPGDRLWVRENFKVTHFSAGKDTGYVDDFEVSCATVEYFDGTTSYRELIEDHSMGLDEVNQAARAAKKKSVPSIHMPRWASRIDLLIKNVRVERLQDISDIDCEAEGVRPSVDGNGKDWRHDETGWRRTFRQLWQSINGPESWDENPLVWVIEFNPILKNIDDVQK